MNKSGGVECLAWTWGIAILVGVFVAALLWTLGGWTFMQGAFMGILALLVVGALLTIMMCRGAGGSTNSGNVGAQGSGASAYVASGVVSPAAGSASDDGAAAASAEADRAAAAAQAEADSAAAAQAEADRAAAQADADAAAKAAADSAAADAAAKAAADSAAADAAAKADADRAAAASAAAAAAPAADAPTGPGTRPAALDGPRGGTADDLKRIKGVGPKMETMCNDLGFYHFDQVAAWSADEVAWVDQNLKGFKGRVSRDNWVEQARLLASGGETEFSKKVDDGNVY